jgi:flagellar biosynthesis protein FlhG
MNQVSALNDFKPGAMNAMMEIGSIAISSGKGGTGKTNMVVNLSLALAEMGMKVAILDADYGLGNIDILLGIEPEYDVYDLMHKDLNIEDIIIQRKNLTVIPASSGLSSLTRLTEAQELKLYNEINRLQDRVDLLIVDTAAGITSNVISWLAAVDEICLVVSNEPASIVDTYAVIKIITHLDIFKPVNIIPNMVSSRGEADEVFLRVSKAARNFLNKDLEYLGSIKHDKKLIQAVKSQNPVIEKFPESSSSRDFNNLARMINGRVSKLKRN